MAVVFPQAAFDRWRSQALAHIHSPDGRTYLAQVTSGPFGSPIGLPAEAIPLVTAQIGGMVLTPPYYGRAELTILGELLAGQVTPPLRRPLPNSPVVLLDDRATREVLHCDGDIRLGKLFGFDDIPVGLRSTEKHHLPRHTLVVGTTGSGKSTFVAGLIERLAAAGFCVLVFDVEGEYTTLHRPADSPRIVPALTHWGQKPTGLRDSYLLLPPGATPSDPDAPPTRRFCLRFEDIAPDVLVELIQANEAQAERFRLAYDLAVETLAEITNTEIRAAMANWDDRESGCPGLRLAHVLDAVTFMGDATAKVELKADRLRSGGFASHAEPLQRRVQALGKQLHSAVSWRKTLGLLNSLHRAHLFDLDRDRDNHPVGSLNFPEMLRPGRTLVVDLSGLESPSHRNLTISGLLRGVVAAQDDLYEKAPPQHKPRTVVILEEAHEFLSGERVRQMPAVMGQIERIARRGRKRWLGLLLSTQFPQHIPSELFSLCNTRVLLRLADEPTITRLQRSMGGISDSLWGRLRHLPPGQAVVSAHGIDPALLVHLEPGRLRLRMVD